MGHYYREQRANFDGNQILRDLEHWGGGGIFSRGQVVRSESRVPYEVKRIYLISLTISLKSEHYAGSGALVS